ncbi:hypothetical protein [Tsukamurella paurometabola]|uniref:Uncharacterized protein n=1 Tax=Tsukamurella paurometabola TaxID=2061 RepID=A0ABS5NHD5_TSUPA|nr:hypothetical protein [Tsukamurella paurometabola]MBS4103711.1 hypothetical protein [Tsukamurella paurometabola]
MTENNYEAVEREAVDDQELRGTDTSKAADLEAVFDTAWQDGRRPERQCTAHRTNGDPCRRAAINGGTVCATHGGRSPQVKAKARVRLEMAADRMAKELLKIAVSDDAPDTVKLNAIKDALDRAGLSAKTAVEVEVGPSKAFEDVLGAVLSGGSRAASRAERGVPDADDPNTDWLEGEIVDAQTTDVDDEAPAPRPRPREEPAIPTSAPDTGLMDMETALAQLRAATPPPAPTGTRRGRTK